MGKTDAFMSRTLLPCLNLRNLHVRLVYTHSGTDKRNAHPQHLLQGAELCSKGITRIEYVAGFANVHSKSV
jgi:hypothetical protein